MLVTPKQIAAATSGCGMRDHSASRISATPQKTKNTPVSTAATPTNTCVDLGASSLNLGIPFGRKRYCRYGGGLFPSILIRLATDLYDNDPFMNTNNKYAATTAAHSGYPTRIMHQIVPVTIAIQRAKYKVSAVRLFMPPNVRSRTRG